MYQKMNDICHTTNRSRRRQRTFQQKTVGELAGLLQGDILIEINGERIENSFTVMKLTLEAFGDVWNITVKRGDELISLKIRLNEYDSQK